MKLKEKIYDSITTMDNNELWFLYEQIQMLQHFKQLPHARMSQIAIEDILEMTGSVQAVGLLPSKKNVWNRI